jgi:cytochrome c-type biogenesis protein CcmE
MAQATWEKTAHPQKTSLKPTSGRWKFLAGGVLILVAVAYLVISGTLTSARFFITVDEVVNNPQYAGQTVQITGAVIGDTIRYDPESGIIQFTIANMPAQFDDLATALHQAVNNPYATRLPVIVHNSALPDLLQHEAQAILPGRLGPDGVFYATDLLLKCPSRFEEAGPGQAMPVGHPEI